MMILGRWVPWLRRRAAGFPGTTPEEMLVEITRHSGFTAEEFNVLATEQPIDVPALRRRVRRMIEDAERFIARLSSDAVGAVFMDHEISVQPDVTALDTYQQRPGAVGGFWPSSLEISRAMLERYGKRERLAVVSWLVFVY